MAVAKSETQPTSFSKKQMGLFALGGVLTWFGMWEMLDEPKRIMQEVVTQIPDLPQDKVHSALEEVRNFDSANGELIRKGELTISVPSAVAARLQISYGILDQNSDNIKKRQHMTKTLLEESYAFDLDPQNFNLGRSSRALVECVSGLSVALATTGAMLLRNMRQRR